MRKVESLVGLGRLLPSQRLIMDGRKAVLDGALALPASGGAALASPEAG